MWNSTGTGRKDGHEQGTGSCWLQSVIRILTTRPQAQPIQALHQSVKLLLFNGRLLLTGQVSALSEGQDRTSCCVLNVSTERFDCQIVCQSCRRKCQQNLTISLLISSDVDCSAGICCGAGLNPVCAVKPEAPRGTVVDMSWLKMIGCNLQGGRKQIARKCRKCEVYAGSTASDSALARWVGVNHHSVWTPGDKQVHTTHVPEVGLDGMRRDGQEQWGERGCRGTRVTGTRMAFYVHKK